MKYYRVLSLLLGYALTFLLLGMLNDKARWLHLIYLAAASAIGDLLFME